MVAKGKKTKVVVEETVVETKKVEKRSKADESEAKQTPKKKAKTTTPEPATQPTELADPPIRAPEGKLCIVSWNINGLKAFVKSQSHTWLSKQLPDIICLQEVKCTEKDIPKEILLAGYHAYWSPAEKAGYAGTGLLSKVKPTKVTYGIGNSEHDSEGRTITAEFPAFHLVNVYVPNAGRGLVRLDYRMTWDDDFRAYLKKLDEEKPVILCGDLNVAHNEIDIANPKSNKKNAGFTQEERGKFGVLLSENNFIDSFRYLYPAQAGAYTFWTYMRNARANNIGWRLDYFLLSARLLSHLHECTHHSDVMGSDHCPVSVRLDVTL